MSNGIAGKKNILISRYKKAFISKSEVVGCSQIDPGCGCEAGKHFYRKTGITGKGICSIRRRFGKEFNIAGQLFARQTELIYFPDIIKNLNHSCYILYKFN